MPMGPASSSSAVGPGSPNTIAKFTDTDAVGDSTITDDGTSLITSAVVFRPAANQGAALGSVSRQFSNIYTGLVSTTNLTAEGVILFTNLPTSDPAVVGQLWNNLGVVTVSAG